MRFVPVLMLSFGMGCLHAAIVDQVGEGELTRKSRITIGCSDRYQFPRAGSDETFRYWLSVCRDADGGTALAAACAEALRNLSPQPSILVSSIQIAVSEQRPLWQLCIGSRIPAAVVSRVLACVRARHAGPIMVQPSNDGQNIISCGPATADDLLPTSADLLDRLSDSALDDDTLKKLLATQVAHPTPTPAPPVRADHPLLDWDLRGTPGQPPVCHPHWQCDGTAWTADGLYLPGRQLVLPKAVYPARPEDFAQPSPPYHAALTAPASLGRTLTVTMQVCLASNQSGQDHLFTIGRDSRWLTVFSDPARGLTVGFANHWHLFPLLDRTSRPLRLVPGRWHTLSLGVNAETQSLSVLLDGLPGSPAAELIPDRPHNLPSLQPAAGDEVLTFVDPGSRRHLHGLVRRIIIHAGRLDLAGMVEVQRRLMTDLPAPPSTAVWSTAIAPALMPPPPPAPGDLGGNRF